jgi:hypothetical protein
MSDIRSALTTVANSLLSIAGYASSAAASAASAASAPGTSATSTTALTIGLGAKSLTIQTGKSLSIGMQVLIANTASPTNWMAGSVTAYTSGTGALNVTVSNISGAAVGVTTWTVSLIGAPGVSGVLNELLGLPLASAATVNLDAATGNMVHITGNVTITAITLAAGSRRTVIFDGTPTLTHGAATIVCPSAKSIQVQAGDRAILTGDAAGSVQVIDYVRANGQALIALGLGGRSTSSGSTTLVYTDAGAQAIATTAPGQYVILPDATTCVLGNNVFSVYNTGDFALGIKDNSGNQLGWIPPHKSLMIGLANQATAAGIWSIPGIQKMAVTASLYNSLASNPGSTLLRVSLDATRTMLFFSTLSASFPVYAVIYDSSAQQFGAITPVAASASSFGAILSAANQVLVNYANGGTALTALTLTTAGTAITVNASATAPLGGNATAGILFPIAQVGTSFVCGINRASSVASIVAMTISGTTVTCGAEVVLATATATAFSIYGASATVLLTIVQSNAGTSLVACPYTITGTAAAIGTPVTLTGISGAIFKSGVIGANWYVVYGQGSSPLQIIASIITVAAAVATASTVTAITGLGTATYSATGYDLVVIGSKLVLSGNYISGAGTSLLTNIVTNTAGVASIGATFNNTLATTGGVVLLSVIGSVCRFAAFTSSSQIVLYGVDATGASASVSIIAYAYVGTYSATFPAPSASSRSGGVISNGGSWYCPSNGWSVVGNQSQICIQNQLVQPEIGMSAGILSQSTLFAGAANNEMWSINNQSGILLQRIECAA